MKLLEKDRQSVIEEIRKGLKKELKTFDIKQTVDGKVSVDDSKRIKLPKEYEDEILFDYYHDLSGRRYKVFAIIEDLYKIDLSGVDTSYINYNHSSFPPLDLSYSNLRVDFRKTFQATTDITINVSDVDFSHMDLSYLDFDFQSGETLIFDNCNLSNTKLHINDDDKDDVEFRDCDLSENDLSNLHLWILADDLGTNGNMYTSFSGCNLKNTGVNIELELETFKNSKREKETIKELLCHGYLDGCFINDKKVKSKEELMNAKIDAAANYINFVHDEARRVLKDIKSQTAKLDKRFTVPGFLSDDEDDEKLGIGSSYGYDQEKIEKACESAGKIKSNKQYTKKKTLDNKKSKE